MIAYPTLMRRYRGRKACPRVHDLAILGGDQNIHVHAKVRIHVIKYPCIYFIGRICAWDVFVEGVYRATHKVRIQRASRLKCHNIIGGKDRQ
jgi:hypothetical protein